MDSGVKTQQKSTFIVAALVILLCLVSITGATYALFTSDKEDGTIGINATSGDLEVDIIDASKDPSTLVGEVLDFVTDPPRDEILFEPGATYYTEGFRIKNNGEIPLKYILYLSEDKQDPELAALFADAFDVWITNDKTVRDADVKMQEFSGELKPDGESDIYYLVVRMKPSAGNKLQDKTFSGIGITVCAVQLNGSIYRND